jgi:Phage tail tube protein
MGQVTGRVTIKLGSESLRSKAGATLNIGGITREFDVTDQLESYYIEKGTVATLKATMPHMSDTDLIALRNFKNGTAYYETDTGHLYTIPNASIATIGDLSNGEVEVTVMGDPAQV